MVQAALRFFTQQLLVKGEVLPHVVADAGGVLIALVGLGLVFLAVFLYRKKSSCECDGFGFLAAGRGDRELIFATADGAR